MTASESIILPPVTDSGDWRRHNIYDIFLSHLVLVPPPLHTKLKVPGTKTVKAKIFGTGGVT